MARIPSIEEILLEIHQSLGLKQRASTLKGDFSNLGRSPAKHQEMTEELLDGIFDTLGVGQVAQEKARHDIERWRSLHKVLELRTWTGPASQQQILWYLLAYAYVPTLAHRLASWELANKESELPILDAGMPNKGRFWFLPQWHSESGDLTLPMAHVIDWIRDILGKPSWQQLGAWLAAADEDPASVSRTLQNWRNGIGPQSKKEIDDRFSNKRDFERQVAVHHASIDMSMIILRLRIARLSTDAYKRLVKLLRLGVTPSCTDQRLDKVRQLIGLFEFVYSLTIEARTHGNTEAERDAWFAAQLPPQDKGTLFRSILPSRQETAFKELAYHLTRRFFELRPDDPLPDIWLATPYEETPIFQRRGRIFEQDIENFRHIEQLKERVRATSPWRTLQAENSYWVVSQFAQDADLPLSMRGMAVQRMRELAVTESEKVGTILIELGNLLDCPPKQRPPGMRERVAALLSEVEESPGKDIWAAPWLRMRAKHKLAQDDLKGAASDFRDALDACSRYSYGGLRGEIAHEVWATDLAQVGFVPENQEKFYRNMLGYMEFPDGPPAFEDAAVECEEFFWNTLYRPYPGVERREPPANIEFKRLLDGTFDLIAKADWEALRVLLTRHARKLKNRKLPEARRDSVLMLWMKFMHGLESAGAFTQRIMPPAFEAEFSKLASILANWHQAIRILIEVWPEQAGIPDFKGQTPLMLAADHGDTELVALLLSNTGCDVNAQDYLGRTALHAAVTGQSAKSVAAMLEAGPNPYKVTQDEQNTALHTAVRMGDPNIARLILDRFPKLGTQPNEFGRTALDMARDYLNDYDGFAAFMWNRHGRRIGSRADFEHLVSLLSESTA